MPAPLDVPLGVKRVDGRWVRSCPNCSEVVSHLRRNYCIHSHLLKQPCKRCSNKNNHPSGMHGHVRIAWYNSFMKSAVSRGLEWCITIDLVNQLYLDQDKKCALTGLDIGWSTSLWDHTASIDRIDNQTGYVEGNIQLVHKEINMMRGSLDIKRFQELCTLVHDKVKW